MLKINDLHTHYGLSHILQGLSIEVGKGQIVALVGRNGVGKSTALKTIAGWVAPTSGIVQFQGQSIGGLTPDAICRRGIAMVPEDRRIFPGLSVQENLNLGLLQVPGRSRSEKRAAIDRAFNLFPRLKERRNQAGTTLSGGEQQMLSMARVLVGEPALMLIDEPTEGLAPIIVDELFKVIVGLRDSGISIVLVEQNVYKTLEIADRAYAVERGRVIYAGDPSDVEQREQILKAISV